MQEVGGSIPPGSTSLRSLRELRLGRPGKLYRSEVSEGCPAIARRATAGLGKPIASTDHLAAVSCPSREDAPCDMSTFSKVWTPNTSTDDLRARLAKHNAGEVPHTSKYRPWRLRTYIAFDDEQRAIAFEKYLKSGSGRAFAKKHF
jgi:putative endonuclease